MRIAKTKNYFYTDKPLFGIDIGHSSIKVMQIDKSGKKPMVTGYGVIRFNSDAIKNGVIVNHEAIASSILDLFKNQLVGKITTKRAAIGIPASRTFNRVIKLPPKLSSKELADAVRLEAEQYIPVSVEQLYLDHTIISQNDQEIELFAVAVPKAIVDSHIQLAHLLDLDVTAMETTIAAAGRVFVQADRSDLPTILIDFGSISTDITIFDKTLLVTGTVQGGGDDFTKLIASKLGTSYEEANVIKTKYGLRHSKKQAEITEVLSPMLEQMVKEIRRMQRYYEERYGNEKSKIGQIVVMGGGSNVPGISEYLTNELRLPVRGSEPWQHISFGKLQPPSSVEKSMYITVAGLALIDPKEIFS
jgi:type IV pilus assembly protein PilM